MAFTSGLKLCLIALLLASAAHAAPAAAADAAKPVFLWSGYFNAKGENRYTPNGNYRDVMDRLRKDFEVRIDSEPLNAQTLKGVSVVLISNPNDKASKTNPPPHHMSDEDVTELTRFVKAGGGLIVMGNQEGHNIEIKDFNKLLSEFGMTCVNNYTDAKQVNIPKEAPILGGLRWAYYTGNQVIIEPNNASHARSLVENDPSVKALGGPRNPAGTLLAIAEPGMGHVVVATDAGWITNDAMSGKGIGKVAIKDQDNLEIMVRLTKWAAGSH
jgi:unsaturated rhamnogalacturonyl hydrolase